MITAHDEWPQLVTEEPDVHTLHGLTAPISMVALYTGTHGWVGLLKDRGALCNAVEDETWRMIVFERLEGLRSAIQVYGYNLNDLACQMRDTLEEGWHVKNPTIRIRVLRGPTTPDPRHT